MGAGHASDLRATVILLVDALFVNLGTIKPGRQHAEIDGVTSRVIFLLCFSSASSGRGRAASERRRDEERQRQAGRDGQKAD